MNARNTLLAVFAALVAASPCWSQAWYVADLGPGSRFEYGCFDPCACPIYATGVTSGRMTLFRGDVIDPGDPFLGYDVVDVAWKIAREDGSVGVMGSGMYRRGLSTSEHQLVLDLSVDGGPVQRFDSGLVPRTGGEDAIDLDVSLHGEFCFDSVFRVRATFRTTGVPGGGAALAPRVYPNPFGTATEVAFATTAAGPVDVRVFDLAGRPVATLARGWRPAGPVVLHWDGRRADGRRAPAGVYLVRVVAAGQVTARRLALVP